MPSTTNWLDFGSFSNDAAVGTVAWNSPGSAAVLDGVAANANDGGTVLTNYLKALNPQNVPIALQGAIILGVEVRIACLGGEDSIVKLVKDGAVVGNNKAAGVWNSSSFQYLNHGGATDLWGIVLNAAAIGANFGVVLSAIVPGAQIQVDHMQIRFHYHPSGMFAVI